MTNYRVRDNARPSGRVVGFGMGVVATVLAVAAVIGLSVTGGATSSPVSDATEVVSLPAKGTAGDGRSIGPIPDSPDAPRPDLVPAVDRAAQIVGYVRSDEIEPQLVDGELVDTPENIDVVGLDGRTVVGQMIAGVGFVSAEDVKSGAPTSTIDTKAFGQPEE